MIRRLFVFTLCLGLSSCAADSRSGLVQEVHGLVAKGMPFDRAEAALEKAGFRCGESQPAGDSAAASLCSRTRSHHILASCVQNVHLTASAEGNRVEALEIPDPSCAGF